MNIWKANGFNNSSNTIEINYKLNHVTRNTNNFVAADCGNWHHISFASFVRGYWWIDSVWIDFKMKSFIIITLEFTKKRPSIILFQILYKNPKLQSLKPLNQTLTLALQQQKMKWKRNEIKKKKFRTFNWSHILWKLCYCHETFHCYYYDLIYAS